MCHQDTSSPPVGILAASSGTPHCSYLQPGLHSGDPFIHVEFFGKGWTFSRRTSSASSPYYVMESGDLVQEPVMGEQSIQGLANRESQRQEERYKRARQLRGRLRWYKAVAQIYFLIATWLCIGSRGLPHWHQGLAQVHGQRSASDTRAPGPKETLGGREQGPNQSRPKGLEPSPQEPTQGSKPQGSDREQDQELRRLEAGNEDPDQRRRAKTQGQHGEASNRSRQGRSRSTEGQCWGTDRLRDALRTRVDFRRRRYQQRTQADAGTVPTGYIQMRLFGAEEHRTTRSAGTGAANGTDDNQPDVTSNDPLTRTCSAGQDLSQHGALPCHYGTPVDHTNKASSTGSTRDDSGPQEAEAQRQYNRSCSGDSIGREGGRGTCRPRPEHQPQLPGQLRRTRHEEHCAKIEGCRHLVDNALIQFADQAGSSMSLGSFTMLDETAWNNHSVNPCLSLKYLSAFDALLHLPSRAHQYLIRFGDDLSAALVATSILLAVLFALVYIHRCLNLLRLPSFQRCSHLVKVQGIRHCIRHQPISFKMVLRRTFLRFWGTCEKRREAEYVAPTSPRRSTSSRRLRWWLGPFLVMLLNPHFVTAHPASESMHTSGRSSSTTSPANIFREITVHRLHRSDLTIQTPISTSPDNAREVIGQVLQLQRHRAVWQNFQLWQIQFPPLDHDRPLVHHVILEAPGDRTWHHSLVLYELIDGNNGGPTQREVLRIPSRLSREEFIDYAGLTDECSYSTCNVKVDGNRWLSTDSSTHLVKQASVVTVFLRDEREFSRSSSRTSSWTTSRSARPASPAHSDESMLMQTSHREAHLQRLASDPVYRMSLSRTRDGYLQQVFGITISVWPIVRHNLEVHTTELRVWLDSSQASWTEQCQHHLRVYLLQERDSANWLPFDEFHITTPLPWMRRLTNNNLNFLAIQQHRADVNYILADFWIRGHPIRAALGVPLGTTLAQLVQRTPFRHEHRDYRMTWTTASETTIFIMHDTIVLPNGAFVDIEPLDCPQPPDEQADTGGTDPTALLQLKLTIGNIIVSPKGSSNHRAPVFWPYGPLETYHSLPIGNTEGRVFDPILKLRYDNVSSELCCKRQRIRSKYRFLRPPTEGLQPPGNPQWLSHRWDAMDQVLHYAGETFILDYITTPSTAAQEHRQQEHLMTLQKSARSLPTPVRSNCSLPRTINLCDSLPVEAPDHQQEELHTPTTTPLATLDLQLEDENFLAFLDFNPIEEWLQVTFPDDLELHPETQTWLQAHPHDSVFQWDPANVAALHIYTDGTFHKNSSAWAFAIFQRNKNGHIQLLGFAGRPVSIDPHHNWWIGSIRHSAATAETEALLWATWWTLRMIHSTGWFGTIEFHWDSTCAGLKAQGLANYHNYLEQGVAGERLRSLQQALTVKIGNEWLHHHHVKAHAGEPLNELVDKVAKYINRTSEDLFQVKWPVSLLLQELPHGFTWLWLYLQNQPHLHHCRALRQLPGAHDHEQYPHWDNGQLQWRFRPHSPFAPTEQAVQEIVQTMTKTSLKPTVDITIAFDIQMASYNVLSFGEHLEGHEQCVPGRVQLLRQLCHDRRLHVLGIQEGRAQHGTFVSDSYIRFCAGKEADGTAGVELWFSRKLPIGYNNNHKPLFFDKNFFHVKHFDPRLLVIEYKTSSFEATFVTGHAPHNAKSLEDKESWWKQLHQQVHPACLQHRCFLMLDANARIDTVIDNAFGGRSEDQEDSNSPLLRTFAHNNELIAPSTFDYWHEGQNHTWHHPSGQTVARLDYILVPHSWHAYINNSWVDETLHLGHPVRDHNSVGLRLTWTQATPWTIKPARNYDRQAVSQPTNRNKIATIIETLPQVPWSTNATEHARIVVQHLQQQLCVQFPASTRNRAPATASAKAQELHVQLTHHKRNNRAVKRMAKDTLMRTAFAAWRGSTTHTEWYHWLQIYALSEAITARDIRQCAADLRQQLLQDKQQYLDGLAEEAAHLNATEVFRALKPVLKSNKKAANNIRPLPTVRKLDGSSTTTLEEYHARWLEHFASIEAGHPVEPTELVRDALQRQHGRAQPATWTLQDLPSLHWLEKAARKIRNGRAAGPDDLPGELLKAFPAATARALLPLLWKLFLRIEEPVAFKGGTLIRLWKHRGALDQCSSFRGILLMSTVGKLIRAAARDSINQYYTDGTSSLQMAGKPGQTVLFGTQIVRSFLNQGAQQHASTIILFGDVSAAFYRALREVATGATLADEDISLIVHRLGLGPEVVPTLADAIRHGSAYTTLGANAVHNAVLNETLSETWFQMEGPAITRTTRGSRPGDSLADIIFNALFSQVLASIEKELKEAGLILTVNKPFMRCPFLSSSTPQQLPIFQITWADDVALLLQVSSVPAIPEALTTAAFQLHNTLAKHAMQLSYGKHKTAALVVPRGKGALQMRRRLFAQADATIPILTEDETVWLPLVPAYVHLGHTVAVRGGLLPELRARAAKAFAAFRRAAKTVYQAKAIPLTTRTTLFRSTVMSIWMWGAGAWPWLNAAEMSYFTTTTWKLYRLLIRRPFPDCNTPISNDEVFLQLKLPRPGDLLHEARLRHIGLMVLSGPDEVWALHVQDEQARHASREAVDWMHKALQTDTELSSPMQWDPWLQLMRTRPSRWKHLVSVAAYRYLRYRSRNSKITLWHHEMLEIMEVPRPLGPDTPGVLSEKCLLCHRVFKNRRAWFLHAFYKHSYRTPHGVAAQGTTCPCCNRQYPHSMSLRNHLRYSPRCCATMHLRDLLPHRPPAHERHPQLPWTQLHGDRVPHVEVPDIEVQTLQSDLSDALHSFPVLDDDDAMVDSIFEHLKQVLTRAAPFPKLVAAYQGKT